jgi:outer membrane lipopolysaccharide assembly protein LptE/RlpB
LLAATLLAGCGYHFPGGGSFPAGIESVYLEMAAGDSPLRRALERGLRRDGDIRLAGSPSAADAVLRISGGGVRSSAAALNEQGVATEYEVSLSAGYELLLRTPEGEEPVQSRSGLNASRTFPYADSPTQDEANQREAAEEAAQELARRILRSIREGF